ncbi:MAG: CaiB/BaiF CoA-transferase family protein [Spirochaetota bacterium]
MTTKEPPLSGVKVLDLSMLLPGPLCSMYLGDMGAEVIKVENPRAYDATRAMGKKGEFPGLFYMLNRNKKAITLNVKKKESQEILYRLLENTDILLEGFRPTALAGMGIGYEDLHKRFPRLIYCGIYGYGDSGPYRDFAGHDANYLALSGVLGLSGESGRGPSLWGAQIADIGGGSLTALSGILAALYCREKNGYGQKVDVSMMEGSLQFAALYWGTYLSTGKLPERGKELLSGKLPNYSIYQTADKRYVVLAALEERFFRAFLRQASIALEYPIQEEYYKPIRQQIAEYFSGKTCEEIEGLFHNPECCLSLIKTFAEVLQDPHLQERGVIFSQQDSRYGKVTQIASPFRFSASQLHYMGEPPTHGQHNQQVYQSLGYTQEQIQEWEKKRII